MRFLGLCVDPTMTRAMLFAKCKATCKKLEGDPCDSCAAQDAYIEQSFNCGYDSIVMHPTRIFEIFFFPGPVTFYTLMAGYLVIGVAIERMCNPASTFVNDADWNAKALPARKKIAQRVGIYLDRIVAAKRSASTRLELVQAMEFNIIVYLVAMEESLAMGAKMFTTERVDAELDKLTTRSIMPWIYDRCGADQLTEKLRCNAAWNVEWARRKMEQQLQIQGAPACTEESAEARDDVESACV